MERGLSQYFPRFIQAEEAQPDCSEVSRPWPVGPLWVGEAGMSVCETSCLAILRILEPALGGVSVTINITTFFYRASATWKALNPSHL